MPPYKAENLVGLRFRECGTPDPAWLIIALQPAINDSFTPAA